MKINWRAMSVIYQVSNCKGITIMETLISIGLASIIGLGMASMVVSQNKEVVGLTEKLVIKDLESRLQKAILVDNFCSCLFRSSKVSGGMLINPPVSIPGGYNQPIPNVPAACTAAGTSMVPTAGNYIPESKIKIASIGYSNLVRIGTNQYSANIDIKFDTSTAVRAIKGIKGSFVFTANSSGDFLNCGPAKNSSAIAIAYRGGGFSVTPSETGRYQVDFIGSVRGRSEGETFIWMTMNGLRNPTNPTESRCGHRDAGSGGNTFIHCPFHMTEFWSLTGGTTYNFSHSGNFPGGGYLLGGGASDAMWILRKK